jgi:hypothetical protein
MVDSDKPIGFLAFKRDEDGVIDEFAVLSDRERLEKWKAGLAASSDTPSDPPSVEEPKSNSEEPTPSSRDVIISLLDRFGK